MRIILFILIAFSFFASQGQKKPVLSKLSKLKTFLGKNENGAIVPVDEALQLINFPLRIVDADNERCMLISYHLMYKRKSFFEDETTGKKEVAFSQVGDLFKETPLPSLWRKNMSESLKKDEELFFYDIIIKDKQGRRRFAPELKIKIQ